MANLTSNIKFDYFVDRPAVMSAADRAEKRVLIRYGALTRTKSKRSIRKRKRSALPGSPPSSHEGSLKRLIFFAFDPHGHEVVIGPLQFKSNAAPQLENKFPFMSPAALDTQENELPDIMRDCYSNTK